MTSLAQLGWREFFAAQLGEGERALRVAIEHQDRFTLLGESERFDAKLTGVLRKEAARGEFRPAVGDWVKVDGKQRIERVLDRATSFRRRSPRGDIQVIAANIDKVFVVSSCNAEFNPRRIERYLGAVAQSGASPVLVLSKIDLCDDPKVYEREMKAVAGTAPTCSVATPTGEGLDTVKGHLAEGQTIALVGSSGVGKSTLANALLGQETLRTAPIREQDGKGRHTTTRRELMVLPDNSGVLIDTPGMRELQLDLEAKHAIEAFDDIEELSQSCQFRDCRHDKEPGCAVKGKISEKRLASFQKLRDKSSRRNNR